LLRLLLEGVQHIDVIPDIRHIEYTERTSLNCTPASLRAASGKSRSRTRASPRNTIRLFDFTYIKTDIILQLIRRITVLGPS